MTESAVWGSPDNGHAPDTGGKTASLNFGGPRLRGVNGARGFGNTVRPVRSRLRMAGPIGLALGACAAAMGCWAPGRPLLRLTVSLSATLIGAANLAYPDRAGGWMIRCGALPWSSGEPQPCCPCPPPHGKANSRGRRRDLPPSSACSCLRFYCWAVRNVSRPARSSVLMWSTPARWSSVHTASRASPGWSGVAQKRTRYPLAWASAT